MNPPWGVDEESAPFSLGCIFDLGIPNPLKQRYGSRIDKGGIHHSFPRESTVGSNVEFNLVVIRGKRITIIEHACVVNNDIIK